MVPSIGRGACQNNIMILSAFHRHDGISSFSSTEVQDNPTATEQLHTSSPGPNNGIDIADEHDFSIISAMQVSERCGVYDPSRKFIYQTEQPVDLEQQQDDSADKKRLPGVDEKCRAKMLDWCAKMVDYFDIDRSIVATSAYYQDRFLGTKTGEAARNNRSIFRVVSVTSLYIAIKLRVPHRWNITAHAFAQLCQGSVSGDEISDMEIDMLFSLGWNVNPPIPMEYAEAYLDLVFNCKESQSRQRSSIQQSKDNKVLGDCMVPSYVQESSITQDEDKDYIHLQELRDHVKELIEYQLEIALHDNRLLQVRSSVIATASVLNALEGLMNESPFFHGGAGGTSFCQESIVSTLEMMSSCNIASEKELEYIRSVLLSSVVSPSKESEDVGYAVHSTMINEPHVQNCTDPSLKPASQPVSSSPTSPASKLFWSADKMPSHQLTPQSVLSKVSAFHCI